MIINILIVLGIPVIWLSLLYIIVSRWLNLSVKKLFTEQRKALGQASLSLAYLGSAATNFVVETILGNRDASLIIRIPLLIVVFVMGFLLKSMTLQMGEYVKDWQITPHLQRMLIRVHMVDVWNNFYKWFSRAWLRTIFYLFFHEAWSAYLLFWVWSCDADVSYRLWLKYTIPSWFFWLPPLFGVLIYLVSIKELTIDEAIHITLWHNISILLFSVLVLSIGKEIKRLLSLIGRWLRMKWKLQKNFKQFKPGKSSGLFIGLLFGIEKIYYNSYTRYFTLSFGDCFPSAM